jgi:hypothetical protein
MHIGKPDLEQLSRALGGAFFGILACHQLFPVGAGCSTGS